MMTPEQAGAIFGIVIALVATGVMALWYDRGKPTPRN